MTKFYGGAGELKYASHTNKKMIPVILDASCRDTRKWATALQFTLGGELTVDFVSDSDFDKNLSNLYDEINNRIDRLPPRTNNVEIALDMHSETLSVNSEPEEMPIRLINCNDLKKLTSLPRFPENADICTNYDEIDRSASLLIFISYHWLRGWSGAAGWDGRPHPDNDKHEYFQLILEATEHLKREAPGMKDVYIWMDYGCINQNVDPASELRLLNKIVQSCDLVLTPVVDSYTGEWKSWELPSPGATLLEDYLDYKAKSWFGGQFSHLSRSWLRVDMMYASNLPLNEDTDVRIKNFTSELSQAVRSNRRPHYIYGTREKMTHGLPLLLPPLYLNSERFEKFSPLKGDVSREVDRLQIKKMVEALYVSPEGIIAKVSLITRHVDQFHR